jgi:hypothetical protein
MQIIFRLREDLTFISLIPAASQDSALANRGDEVQVDFITQYIGFEQNCRAARWRATRAFSEAFVNEGTCSSVGSTGVRGLGSLATVYLYGPQNSHRAAILLRDVPTLPVVGNHGTGFMDYGRERYLKGRAILWAVASIT